MKERPILFSGEMVRAILEGRKTQTRRIIKPQPYDGFDPGAGGKAGIYSPTKVDKRTGEIYPGEEVFGVGDADQDFPSPYGQPGDRLWVKETYYIDHWDYQGSIAKLPALSKHEQETSLYYAADGDVSRQIPECDGVPKLKPSIFMPRWASRITLEITDVRAERLQEISDEDAVAEGVTIQQVETGDVYPATLQKEYMPESPSDAYARLWETINGKGSWSANPWLWAISFKRI